MVCRGAADLAMDRAKAPGKNHVQLKQLHKHGD